MPGLVEVSHHPAKVYGLKHGGNGDTMFLVYHLISQNQTIIWSLDFIGKIVKVSSHPYAKFSAHWYCSSGDITLAVCHVVSQDQLPAKSYCPAKFGAYKHCGSKRMVILV